MSQDANPYTPPKNIDVPAATIAASFDEGVVPAEVVERFRATRRWVLFLMFIGLILCALFAVTGFRAWSYIASARGGPMGMVTGLMDLPLAACMVPPILALGLYASSIGGLIREPRLGRLMTVIDRQRWVWLITGVTLAIILLWNVRLLLAVMAFATKRSVR
jgi:hypothetical protein